MLAIGHSGPQPNQQGALQLLARQSYGLFVLWVLFIGFIGYALWRISEAFTGVTGEGTGAGARLKSLARGIVYAFIAYLDYKVISGSSGNETKKTQDLSAQVMRHGVGGQFLVAIVGAIIVIVGLALVVQGLRRKFLKDLNTGQMSHGTRKVVEWLGVIGTTARGVIFALVGILVIDAAATYNPSKAGGIDKALLTLRNQPFGPVLLALAALGLLIFGVYGLCEAKWRRV